MPGKPFQSKLAPYEAEVFALLDAGMSYRKVAEEINHRHQLGVTHNAVFSFAKTRRKKALPRKLFYDEVKGDIRDSLLKQIAAIWTHDSTAIEGNTLTLGETVKVLELGLTINGKSLREHQEVYGHARAIDLIYAMIQKDAVSDTDLFDLHRAVMDKSPIDAMNPVGNWKQDFNGTTGVSNGKIVYMEYASPLDTPQLMKRWIKAFNDHLADVHTPQKAIDTYAWAHMSFVRIHPFFDGNGRVARLLANLPVLQNSYPPIVIAQSDRSGYIDLLWEYQSSIGTIRPDSEFMPDHPAVKRFKALLERNWQETLELVEAAKQRQKKRKQ